VHGNKRSLHAYCIVVSSFWSSRFHVFEFLLRGMVRLSVLVWSYAGLYVVLLVVYLSM
jgi:hypothetical protein